MDVLSLATGVAIGVAAGGSGAYFLFHKPKPSKVEQLKLDEERSVNEEEIKKARKELKTLRLEKELLAGALTRVYEAEVEGKITKEERELLASKYKEQLKSVEAKLSDLELVVEVGELESLRRELVGLLEKKIAQIESRLNEARIKLGRVRAEKPEAPVIEKREERKVEKRRPDVGEADVDEKVKALREEVLEALARLEQMDIEG
ncbi:MAG: hypothetical protein QW815_07375 [Nitrososphaerota archaeon]